MTFWDSPTFHEYERLCGDEPGTRARLLASADWHTRVVDLSPSEAELWQGVRKSYKAIIHKAERDYIIGSVDAGCIYSAMKIHGQEAGRLTRPMETWVLMGDWVRDGRGLLLVAGQRRPVEITMSGDQWLRYALVGLAEMRAYVYCTIYQVTAYYFSSASLVHNINHALLWHAMKALKARGVRWFELGWMERAGDDEKARGICQFKRGFGGVDIPAKEAPRLCAKTRLLEGI